MHMHQRDRPHGITVGGDYLYVSMTKTVPDFGGVILKVFIGGDSSSINVNDISHLQSYSSSVISVPSLLTFQPDALNRVDEGYLFVSSEYSRSVVIFDTAGYNRTLVENDFEPPLSLDQAMGMDFDVENQRLMVLNNQNQHRGASVASVVCSATPTVVPTTSPTGSPDMGSDQGRPLAFSWRVALGVFSAMAVAGAAGIAAVRLKRARSESLDVEVIKSLSDQLLSNTEKNRPHFQRHSAEGSCVVTIAECDFVVPKHLIIAYRDLQVGEMLSGGVKGGKFGPHNVALRCLPQAIRMPKKETQILTKLAHPHCIEFYGFSLRGGCLLVTGLCTGGDLRNAMSRNPDIVLSRSHVFMIHIASALEYLHSQEILHSAIKPESIFFSSPEYESPETVLKICEFGAVSAKAASSSYENMALFDPGISPACVLMISGTAPYIAPEMIEGDWGDEGGNSKWVGGAADVYSTGVVYAEIMAPTRQLYSGMGQADIFQAVVGEGLRPALPSNVRFAGMVKKMWDADPTKRPPFTDVLSELRYYGPSNLEAERPMFIDVLL